MSGGLRNVEEAAAVLAAIVRAAEQGNLPFLLIGGLAVVEHGYGRTTDDMDLLIRRAIAWRGWDCSLALVTARGRTAERSCSSSRLPGKARRSTSF